MSNKLRAAIVRNEDRREAPRQDVYDGALIFMEGRPDAICCIVRDVSDTGARIALTDEMCVMPELFRLHIPDQHLMAHCEQIWQKGKEIGLRFRGVAKIG